MIRPSRLPIWAASGDNGDMNAIQSLALMLGLSALSVAAQVPQRDLTVELRQVDDAQSAGYSVGTQPQRPALTQQQVQVRNGEQASLRLGQSIPMQWVESVSVQNDSVSASAPAAGVSSSSRGGSVKNAVTWMDSGQSITLRPRWSGGKQLVTVEVEVQSASVDARNGVDLPAQSRSHVATTVSVALGQWVTIAATGTSAQAGVYSSRGNADPRRLLQIRVQAP